jgi:tetratricopeptide (TPR) repeat protein
MIRKLLGAGGAFASLLLAGWCGLAGETSYPAPDSAPVVPWTRFNIKYTVRDIGGAGPKSVEFYMTTDMGKTWTLYGEDPDARSPMMVQVDGDGVYGFTTVGTDHVGNREREPVSGTRPETVIIVDRTPPTAHWLAPTASGLLAPEGVEFAWEGADDHLPAAPVTIEYSVDNEVNWTILKDRLSAKGRFNWKPTQGVGGSISYRLKIRDSAGNKRLVKCQYKTILDDVPPTVSIVGPFQSGSLQVDVNYTAVDNRNGTGIARVTLYYTTDNGQTWERFGDDGDAVAPFEFNSPVAGRVGLMLVATDKANNQTSLPQSGSNPTFTVEIDNEPPLVRIEPTFVNDKLTVGGGKETMVMWNATDEHILENSGTVYYSVDGARTWKEAAGGVPVNQPYVWKVPAEVQSQDCYLKITAADTLGNVGEARSIQFSIDSTSPKVTIVGLKEIADGRNDGPTSVDEDESARREDPGKRLRDPEAGATRRHPSDIGAQSVFPYEDSTPESGAVLDVKPDNVIVPEPIDIPGETRPEAKATATVKVVIPAENPEPEIKVTPVKAPAVTPKESKSGDDLPKLEDLADSAAKAEEPKKAPGWIDHGSKDDFEDIPVSQPRKSEKTPEKVPEVTPLPKIEATPEEKEDPKNMTAIRHPQPLGDKVPESAEKTDPVGVGATKFAAAEKLFAEGKMPEAFSLCQDALRLDPKNGKAYGLGAQIMLLEDKYVEAADYASRALLYERREPTFWLTLGNAYYYNSKALQKSLDTQAQAGAPAPALEKLVLERNEDIDKARQAFREVIQLAPGKKDGYDRMGDVIYLYAKVIDDTEPERAADLYREAIAAFQKGYAIDRASYSEAFHIGVCHYRLGELKDAQSYLERAIEEATAEIVPKEAFWYLAEIHEKKGELEDSLRYWGKAVKSYPKGPYREAARQKEADIRAKLGVQ